ncbi:sigma-54-dependent Fis family transcriptional regulator [Fodinisporobacter ferrooxydans]|uniref:Sigma-54-dependent Fis family transcriptional regulator n=1 Tax=Fodinisporobacter ferrooxydans TaxID=2901836 RepID=A0ABY4CL69_9BACL|nr:sigma-54-dependent Fis family transcriptional regulator [Alicyclobacillaceae bacterium MYW30-H2]
MNSEHEKLSGGQDLGKQRELEVILNSTHDAMIAINIDGQITIFNAAAERLTQKRGQDVLGENVSEVIPNSRLHEVLRSGQPELNQLQTLGNIRIITNRVPVKDEHGRVIGAVAVFRDVTDIQNLIEEITNLREMQQLLEAIINSTQDAISVVDAEGQGILINPAYTKLTGLTERDIIGQPATVDIAEGESMHLQVLRTGQPVRGVPMKIGPTRREVIVNVAPITVKGQLKGSVGILHDISEMKKLSEELEKAKQLIRKLEAKYSFQDIISVSPDMQQALEQARQAAATHATVLLRGESGTGKELFAHAIHNAGDRRFNRFLRVNCAAISESLLESQLFGYEEGAFTGAKRGGQKGLFEQAGGGTIFLDEIGELSVSTQAKILRVLQEKEIVRVGGSQPIQIDVRIIAATNVNLEKAIAESRFRADLYYRLNVLPIIIPPLRCRKEDIYPIAMRLIRKLNQEYGRNVDSIAAACLEQLFRYDWPGNVRELENVIGRAMIHMRLTDKEIQCIQLPEFTGPAKPTEKTLLLPKEVEANPVDTLDAIVAAAEKKHIRNVLRLTHGNKTEAAKRLGIAVRSLYYKMEKYHLNP